jgi:hypothetical protein
LQKLITNGRADAMKMSCSDTLMYFNAMLWPFSCRSDPHLCVRNIVFYRIRRLSNVSALPFVQRLAKNTIIVIPRQKQDEKSKIP